MHAAPKDASLTLSLPSPPMVSLPEARLSRSDAPMLAKTFLRKLLLQYNSLVLSSLARLKALRMGFIARREMLRYGGSEQGGGLTQQYFDTTNHSMRPLSRSSIGTLYHQILLELTELIESGEIGVGDRLPSEADLVADFGVSRTTARRALDELRRQGLVRREPGRGTFLASPRLRSDLAYLHSFSEEIERWGYTPGVWLASQEERTAGEEVAAWLDIEVGEEVLFVRRLRLADERPIFVCDSHLPVTRFPALRDADYGSVSLSRLFEERTGRQIEHARQWIGAANAAPQVADLLEISPAVPVLKILRITSVTGDLPIEVVEAYFHPERYQHYNELYAQPAEVTG